MTLAQGMDRRIQDGLVGRIFVTIFFPPGRKVCEERGGEQLNDRLSVT